VPTRRRNDVAYWQHSADFDVQRLISAYERQMTGSELQSSSENRKSGFERRSPSRRPRFCGMPPVSAHGARADAAPAHYVGDESR
jgi:hypothetical protein